MSAIVPKVRIHTAQLKAAFDRFSATTKKEIMDRTMSLDARAFVRDVVEITPPGHSDGNNPALLKQGKDGNAAIQAAVMAIRTDLLGGQRSGGQNRAPVFVVQPAHVLNNAHRYSTGNVKLYVKKDGTIIGVRSENFKPDATIQEMREAHKKRWIGGRMRSGGGKFTASGKWHFINAMVVSESSLDRYLSYVCRKIGILAGGWSAAAKVFKTTMPAIAKRHPSGSCPPPLLTEHRWSVRMENTVSYATEADMMRRIKWALNSDKRANRVANRIKFEILAKLKQQGITH